MSMKNTSAYRCNAFCSCRISIVRNHVYTGLPFIKRRCLNSPFIFFLSFLHQAAQNKSPLQNLEDNQHLFDTIRTNKKPRKIKLTLQKPKFISWTVLFTAKTKNEWLGRACSKTALIFSKRVILQQKLIGNLAVFDENWWWISTAFT